MPKDEKKKENKISVNHADKDRAGVHWRSITCKTLYFSFLEFNGLTLITKPANT